VTGLPLTGERTVPGIAAESYWFARHEAVYRWAEGLPAQRVADVGAGEGYGAALLAAHAFTIAIELDEESARHAGSAYPQVAVARANAVALPLASNAVDLCVSLQVIEHVWDVPAYLAELRRITAGSVLVATPNRPVFSPGLQRGERPVNPFHEREFDAEELRALLDGAGFADIRLFGLHHGPRLREWESAHGSVVAAQVAAVIAGRWPEALADFVASVSAEDFALTDSTDGAQDLIALAAA
jgi:SAM-dependent methyltransferase